MVGPVHHSQDINLYSNYIRNVIPIFLDIDYLEFLFSSGYNFMLKKGAMGRFRNPYLSCEIIDQLAPQVSSILFSNNFSPEDYLTGIPYYN